MPENLLTISGRECNDRLLSLKKGVKMNKALTLIAVILSIMLAGLTAEAQLLNQPESIVYDSLYDRYLVSNWASGDLVAIDANGAQSLFVTHSTCFAGICIVGNNVYVAGRYVGVRGFDLETGDMVFDMAIPGSSLLNDITADNEGYLYVSDPQVHKIFRINPEWQSYSTFVDGGISNPNGLFYDEQNNRLLLCCSRNNSPIQAVNIEDSTVSTLINTPLNGLDGLTMDSYGNYYVSSWGSNAIYRFDHNFSGPPQFYSSHCASPADISYNNFTDELAVPIFFGNRVEFVQVEPTGIDDPFNPEVPVVFALYQNYPNPFNSGTNIEYDLTRDCHVKLAVYNILGEQLAVLIDEYQTAGRWTTTWSAEDVSSGMYFYKLRAGHDQVTRKMNLIK
ncbi:MAG: T9SS type A sorting domain-containing protein [candidate division Zixibacteria bacterium]|nr:T9SS type A sorting domain-containing protein [candidate division Zixibacteria bacterium]